MQNRYVGDIGDYVKLAILRALASGPQERRLGVAWWLFPDENRGGDGEHREYVDRPEDWKRFDPELFQVLVTINKSGQRHVRALEDPTILPSAIFARDPIPCTASPFKLRPLERIRWITEISTRLKGCDLVFLDPDNGIAPEGLKMTQRRAGKSVTIEDIAALTQHNRTIAIYHHQTHRKGGNLQELRDLAKRLRKSKLQVSGALRAKPWSPRAFFILNGNPEIHNRAETIVETWEGWISWYPDL